jgi:hypothetical protein
MENKKMFETTNQIKHPVFEKKVVPAFTVK